MNELPNELVDRLFTAVLSEPNNSGTWLSLRSVSTRFRDVAGPELPVECALGVYSFCKAYHPLCFGFLHSDGWGAIVDFGRQGLLMFSKGCPCHRSAWGVHIATPDGYFNAEDRAAYREERLAPWRAEIERKQEREEKVTRFRFCYYTILFAMLWSVGWFTWLLLVNLPASITPDMRCFQPLRPAWSRDSL